MTSGIKNLIASSIRNIRRDGAGRRLHCLLAAFRPLSKIIRLNKKQRTTRVDIQGDFI